MTKSHLKLLSPATENRTVATPLRKPNAELRTREYLTDAEVAKLTEAAKGNRYGHRDATMILLAYRHGFRVGELRPVYSHRQARKSATRLRKPAKQVSVFS